MSEQVRTARVNIAFTPPGEAAARRLIERLPLGALLDAARVSVAFALREGLPLSRDEAFGSANGSNYNVGSVDPNNEIRDILLALHPEIKDDPYRVVETLMSTGALALEAKVMAGDILSLKDLIDTA